MMGAQKPKLNRTSKQHLKLDMDDLDNCPTPLPNSKDDAVPINVVSNPSNVIKSFNRTISVAETSYELTLITMRRSFLLVIENAGMSSLPKCRDPQNDTSMSKEMLIQSFMNENSSLKGLCLAIGGHSTCLIASEDSLASLTLASRLSSSVNNGGPVYVANNMQAPRDTLDQLDFITNLYDKIFQFVRHNYKVPPKGDNEGD